MAFLNYLALFACFHFICYIAGTVAFPEKAFDSDANGVLRKDYADSSELRTLFRSKRSIQNLPSDAKKIVVHNMRGFDCYGASDGAYIVRHGTNRAEKIPGIEGNVTSGVVTDAYYSGRYNIYFEVIKQIHYSQVRQYYALKDGESVAKKINGLNYEPKLLCIHNLDGVIFFGSFNGAYELMQGSLDANKVPFIGSGFVTKITALGKGKYNIRFETSEIMALLEG